MRVAVKGGSEADFGPPTALFRLPLTHPSLAPSPRPFEVSPDGQKFFAAIPKGGSQPLEVVVNWQAGLNV
jgi:hypothetical protein